MNYPTKKLGDVLDYEQPGKYIVNSKHYSADYKTPVLTAGKTFILGNTNEKENIFPFEKLPVIIFDDFTTAVQFVDFPFKVKSSAMKILHPKKNEADAKYLFYLMQTIKLNHVTHKRYWISEYSKIKIPLPPIGEQRKIVAKLERVLGKIKEAKKLCEESESFAVALLPAELHKIFSDGRRRGWEETTFDDLCTATQGVQIAKSFHRDEDKDGYCRYLYISDFYSNKKLKFIEDKYPTKRVKKDDIIIANTGSPGMVLHGAEGILSNNLFKVERRDNRLSQDYLYMYLSSAYFQEMLQSQMKRAAQPHLGHKTMARQLIMVPPIVDQKKIVARLDTLSLKIQNLRQAQTQTVSDFTALEQSVLHQAYNS